MSEKDHSEQEGGGVATAPPKPKPKKQEKQAPKKKPPELMPMWRVLLHNDDHNAMNYVIDTVMELAKLNKQDAELRTIEAHKTGVALLLTTHKERAELYKEQFASKGLTVTIEPEK